MSVPGPVLPRSAHPVWVRLLGNIGRAHAHQEAVRAAKFDRRMVCAVRGKRIRRSALRAYINVSCPLVGDVACMSGNLRLKAFRSRSAWI